MTKVLSCKTCNVENTSCKNFAFNGLHVDNPGGSWRRPGDEKREERKEEAPARPREREREGDGEKSSWRSDKDKENRRTKQETDDDGWTTVRR